MKGKIIFISPDKKLTVKAKQIISELGEDIEVFQGSQFNGVRIAKEQVEKGANIVISRGGTGNLIKRNLKIPVVQIEINGFDFIEVISRASKFSNSIGVVGFENLSKSAEKIKEKMKNAFPIEIFVAQVNNEDEVEEKVSYLYSKGVEVFIGGIAVVNAANKLGCHGMFFESGREAIIEAIREAKHILEVQMNEKENTELMKSIIDFAYDGIIAINEHGKITVFNPVAEKITGKSAEKVIGKPVNSVINNTRMLHVLNSKKQELGEFQRLGDVKIVTNRIPILVNDEIKGVVATFQELEKIQKIERTIRKKLFLKGHIAKTHFNDIVGKSQRIQQVKSRAKKFAKVRSTILIIGETGTGKEMFAQSIHNESQRAKGPFVAVNCAALPENLLESELFGYVEGAFTGARKGGKPGLFELAHNGTIFLDEISEMSSKLQSRLLRVLQEKEVVRIGDDRVIPVDIRVIAASNKDLVELVRKGVFREDLYYRLCILELKIPPLRERKEDIPDLVLHFLKKKSEELDKEVLTISDKALEKLSAYSWPGNIRQLENVIERAVVLCEKDKMDIDTIIKSLDENKFSIDTLTLETNKGILKNMEEKIIKRVLKETNGNKTLAAERLGISVTTLWRKLKQLNIKEN